MKKIIALLMSVSLMLSGTAAMADAEIFVDYNGEYIEYDTAPKNVDGRVMLPFREALEKMGAKVSYDDESRLVTAVKGDTTVTFTLLDDTIYINKSGEKSELKMDVPMLVEDGRTLVPIRFLSGALGMNVGWDNGTVCILDKEQLVSDFYKNAPNTSKLFDKGQPDVNSEDTEIALNLWLSKDGKKADGFDFNMTADSVTGESARELNAVLSLNALTDEKNIKIENAYADIITADGVVYIKTDILKKLSADFEMSLPKAASLLPEDTWYKIDLLALTEDAGFSKEMMDLYISLISGQTKFGIDNIISMCLPDDEEPSVFGLYMLKSIFDAYENIDKYITFEETENGGYKAAFKMDSADLADMIVNMLMNTRGEGESFTPEDIAQIRAEIGNLPDIKIAAENVYDGSKLASSGDVAVKINADEFIINMTIKSSAEHIDDIKEPQVPENAVDILSIAENMV